MKLLLGIIGFVSLGIFALALTYVVVDFYDKSVKCMNKYLKESYDRD